MSERNIISLEPNRLFFLFRRGKHQHIKSLYEKGEIYINTIDYIKKCDQNFDRSDPNEGISKRLYLSNAKVKMCKVGENIDEKGTTINAVDCVITLDPEIKGNIYCLSGIFGNHLLEERNEIVFDTKSFGESIILIFNPKEFINRVIQGLKINGYNNVKFKRVSYYPNDYSGGIDIFKKHMNFSSQNECRFFVPNEKNRTIKINIGSLSDISHIENNTLIKIEYTNGEKKIIRIE